MIEGIRAALGGDSQGACRKRVVALRYDAYFGGAGNFLLEFDELQHFSSARARTLALLWDGDGRRKGESRCPSGDSEFGVETGRSEETGGSRVTRYMVVIERGESSWGAHVPDLPGCVAVGETRDEVMSLIREAIVLHIDGLKEEGLPVPKPVSEGAFIIVEAA